MDFPPRIRQAAKRLRDGHKINRLTVREFLRLFGVERRGAAKIEVIRSILDSAGLATEPDFETAWIDEQISLILKPTGASSDGIPRSADIAKDESAIDEGDEIIPEALAVVIQATEQPDEVAISVSNVETTVRGNSDGPTFRIGSLPAANKNPVAVNVNDSLAKAVTIMLEHDFSQLPVMQGEREVKGTITWKSISSRLALRCTSSEVVADYMEQAEIVSANTTLFSVVSMISDTGYVLVRHNDKKIKGPITVSDLSMHLQALTEPFLSLREIELHVRTLIGSKISSEDLSALAQGAIPQRNPKGISDLSFGEYVRLLQNPATWTKMNLSIDREELTKLLDEVRLIRNDVMHFDPDPMTPTELGTLKRAVRFLQNLYELFPSASAT